VGIKRTDGGSITERGMKERVCTPDNIWRFVVAPSYMN